jgi:hypothetical protein
MVRICIHFVAVKRVYYKFVVHFDALQDETNSLGADHIQPFLLVCGVDVIANVASPVHSSCFGISNVCDIVDMT